VTWTRENQRFSWVHGYLDASRWALLYECTRGDPYRINHIHDFGELLIQWWCKRVSTERGLQQWLRKKRSRGLNLFDQSTEFFYLYDLESELWGREEEILCFQARRPECEVTILEPFRFVHLFYLIERGVRLFLYVLRATNIQPNKITHTHIRDDAYAVFFHTDFRHALPYPWNLSALTRRLLQGREDHRRHQHYTFEGHIDRVLRKNHYTEVIETALYRSVRWQRERRGKPLPGSIKGFSLDVLWHYSESYRYRTPIASQYLRKIAHYWGLNLRWIGYAFLTLLELWLYTLSARCLREIWESYQGLGVSSPTLIKIQKPRWDLIIKERPFLLVQ